MPLNRKPGDRFPDLKLTDHTGETVSISDVMGKRPTLLAFYRGHW
ncbi:MAG: redoxin domain-containing protein [SAR324 cluster bacterium]|nr:redoxin domain-containing protein [SAR324 cluster bacterium]